MQRCTLAIGLIGAALMLEGCSPEPSSSIASEGDSACATVHTVDCCLIDVDSACTTAVGEASAADIEKLEDDGKAVCDAYGVGNISANPIKYSACKAKLVLYQEAIIGTFVYSSRVPSHEQGSLLGDWERACKGGVQGNLGYGWNGCKVFNATTIAPHVAKWASATCCDYKDYGYIALERHVNKALAELATYTEQYNGTAVARLYDATWSTPAGKSVPIVMISVGAATLMVVGAAALLLKSRQTSYSAAMLDDEDEEEAAGDD